MARRTWPTCRRDTSDSPCPRSGRHVAQGRSRTEQDGRRLHFSSDSTCSGPPVRPKHRPASAEAGPRGRSATAPGRGFSCPRWPQELPLTRSTWNPLRAPATRTRSGDGEAAESTTPAMLLPSTESPGVALQSPVQGHRLPAPEAASREAWLLVAAKGGRTRCGAATRTPAERGSRQGRCGPRPKGVPERCINR